MIVGRFDPKAGRWILVRALPEVSTEKLANARWDPATESAATMAARIRFAVELEDAVFQHTLEVDFPSVYGR